MAKLTKKQQTVYDEVCELAAHGTHPSVRSLADRLQTKKHGTERFSDDEIRGQLDALIEKDLVMRLEPVTGDDGVEGPIRFVPKVETVDDPSPPSAGG